MLNDREGTEELKEDLRKTRIKRPQTTADLVRQYGKTGFDELIKSRYFGFIWSRLYNGS